MTPDSYIRKVTSDDWRRRMTLLDSAINICHIEFLMIPITPHRIFFLNPLIQKGDEICQFTSISMCALALAEQIPEIIVYESNGPSLRTERFTQEFVRPGQGTQTVTVVSKTETMMDCYDIPQSVLDGGNQAFMDFYNQTFY
jgi:hypothetical protein